MQNFVNYVLENGGRISPLVIPSEHTNGTGLFNPTVYNHNGKLLVNIRHCQYTLYHAEKNIFEHEYGPLVYLNPDNDITLTTTNYLCDLNENLEAVNIRKINTSKLDVRPLWEFVGLEDVRLVHWDDKLYASGVRRDTTPNGQGRIELSTIELTDNSAKEIDRFRIPAPDKNDSYCEKNWMPVIDLPYHYVKWCNPTEVVKVDPVRRACQTVYLGTDVVRVKHDNMLFDLRGGSQVIPIGDYRVALTHVVKLYQSAAGRKNARYRHCFVVWDKDWNLVKIGEIFDFMSGEIEFAAGMAKLNDKYYLTFGFQDNAAYILEVPQKLLEEFVLWKA